MAIYLLSILSVAVVTPLVDSAVPATVQKVRVGDTAILSCPGDDKVHRFRHWILANGEIIGPWSNRHGYEVWSGKLIIRVASQQASGLYRCVSTGIFGSDDKVETVDLRVVTDPVHELDLDTSKVTAYKVLMCSLVAITVLVVAVCIVAVRPCRRRVPDPTGSPETPTASPLSL